jgi:threonine dehydratase
MNTPFKTPLVHQPLLEIMNRAPVYLKCENVQQTHSFKARGAYHAVQKLGIDEIKRGVITHSSGNHGQALAWAAAMRGMKAHIVVPKNAPGIKVEGIKAQGGIVHFCATGLAAREKKLQEVQAKYNPVFIPPYNHEHIIAGKVPVHGKYLPNCPTRIFCSFR